MRVLVLLVLAIAIALLLPFPGPHVDRYLPIGAVLFRRDALGADAGFFVLTGIMLAVYTGIAFGVLWWLTRLLMDHRRPGGGRA